MKKIWMLFLIAALCGCQASDPSYPRAETVPSVLKEQSQTISPLIESLQKIDANSSGAEIGLVFTQLINQTASAYADGLEINSIAYDQIPEVTDDNLLVQNSYQVNTIYSSWLSGGALYQVARYESGGNTGYQGDILITKTNASTELSVLCNLPDPTLYNEQMPELTISRISENQVDIDGDYDKKRLDQMLVNRQMQYVSGMFSNYLTVNPISDPGLFRFSLTPSGNEYIFSIELSNPTVYNRKADQQMPERAQITEKGNVTASSYRTDKIWTDIYLDSDGVIQKIYSTIQESFTYSTETFQILEEQKLFIHEVPSTTALPFILDFFSSIDKQTLKVGSSFTLRVPISNSN